MQNYDGVSRAITVTITLRREKHEQHAAQSTRRSNHRGSSTAYDTPRRLQDLPHHLQLAVVQQSVAITSHLGAMTNPSNAFDFSFNDACTSCGASAPARVPGCLRAGHHQCFIMGGVTPGNSPKDFTIEYSDSSTWTTALTVTNETVVATSEGEGLPWPLLEAMYWRINVSARNGGLRLDLRSSLRRCQRPVL